jgi:hypothetical protein
MLINAGEDRTNTLIGEWVDTKIAIRNDPQLPSIFSLPDEMSVDGFQISAVREIDLVSQH